MNCFDYEYEKNTAGEPVMRRRCFCGSTACSKPDVQKQPKLDEFGIDQEALYENEAIKIDKWNGEENLLTKLIGRNKWLCEITIKPIKKIQ